MSYILDALRKSEQQRLRGAAPGLLTVQMPTEAGSQPAYVIYGLIAAALISAGVAIGWWRPWQQAHGLSAPEPGPVSTRGPTSRPALPEPPPALPEATRHPPQEASVQEPAAPVEPPMMASKAANTRQDTDLRARAAAETRKLLAQTVAVIPRETAAPAPEATATPALKTVTPVQEKAAEAAPAGAPPQQKVIAMAELPPAILQEIPAMSIPVYSYSSTPGERIVGINDRLLQEGDYVAPGLKLEQIAPDGLVFSYKKYLFRRGIP